MPAGAAHGTLGVMAYDSCAPARLGSLCSGIGGLELGLSQVLSTELAWQSEIHPAASQVLARQFPGVPNLGDLVAVDWAGVEPVDIVCFGFPCQNLSLAWAGEGIEDGTKSRLWFSCLRAVRALRPRVVFLENVSSLVGSRKGRDFTIVQSGLAQAGYDTFWLCLPAAAVGAPHRRERLFLIAYFPDRRDWVAGLTRPQVAGPALPPVPRLLPTPVANDDGKQPHAHVAAKNRYDSSKRTVITSLAVMGIQAAFTGLWAPKLLPRDRGDSTVPMPEDKVDLGVYLPAVRRWEKVLGRPAPCSTDGPAHSTNFVEWMQGYADGWTAGISRSARLHCLGNSVVPQQAAMAARLLLQELAGTTSLSRAVA